MDKVIEQIQALIKKEEVELEDYMRNKNYAMGRLNREKIASLRECIALIENAPTTPATSWKEVKEKAEKHANRILNKRYDLRKFYEAQLDYLSRHWPVSPTPMSETWEESKLARMVIEVLENKARYCCDSVSWKGYQNGNGAEVGVDIDKVIGYAKSIINSAPSLHQVDRWVRVVDRLPERGIGVLVQISNGMTTIGYLKKNEVAWQLFGDLDISLCVTNEDYVTHWQPLPAAPETDKKEQ